LGGDFFESDFAMPEPAGIDPVAGALLQNLIYKS
jgi:hypothetical protein